LGISVGFCDYSQDTSRHLNESRSGLEASAAVETFGDRLAERGNEKMEIIGAAMRKLLHICYGALKNGAPFDSSLHPRQSHLG